MGDPIVLVTGATGFLGGATVAELLRARPDCRVLALVRGSSDEEARVRVQRSLARFRDDGSDRVDILRADITDAQSLGDPRLDQVTHVIHAAANTSFRSVRSVRRANIFGALALAHRLRRAPHLERYIHIGTAFCCGEAARGAVLGEDDYPCAEARHVVEYTRAKAEAEMLLEATAPELPLVIARPSVVVGHTRLGVAPSASLFWFYRTADLLRRVSWPMDVRDDIVPVDYVAAALVALLFKRTLAHGRYHISAGARASCSWTEIAQAFARHHGTRTDDPYREIDAAALRAERSRMAARLGPGDEERMLMALELYYSFPNVIFDNSRLLAEGVPAPTRFVDYLDVCMATSASRSVYAQMTDDD